MTIYLLDRTARGGARLPAWLAGCPHLVRVATEHGDLVSTCEPYRLGPPAVADWRELVDGWWILSDGQPDELHRWSRQRKDLPAASVEDARGQAWAAPRVLDQGGEPLLPLPWGRDSSGARCRVPTPEQHRLLTTARAARAEIVAKTLGCVPMDVAAEWVETLLEAAYHLSGLAMGVLGLIDDRLAVNVLLAAAGFDPLPAG